MIPGGGRGLVAAATTAALASIARCVTTVACVTIAGLVTIAACAPRTVAPPRLPESAVRLSSLEQLRRDLGGLFGDPSVAHAQWAVTVKSLRQGDALFGLNSSRLMVPASSQKLLTTAVAAERLGWDYRYTTRIYATGPTSADGTLSGDLVVASDGDPTINPRHPERWAVLDEWARQLAARGIHLVAGQLVGDDNAFAEPGWGMGWSWDDFPFGYSAPVGALQYNENQVELQIGPGIEPGARAIISMSPLGSGLTIDHGVVTAPAGAETRIAFERMPGSSVLGVRGQVALDAAPITETAAVANPTLMYVNAFREALARHRIFVGGTAVDIDDLRLPPTTAGATLLIEDRSPPLSDIVDATLKWSRNGYAETLLRSMAPAGSPATADAGLKALRETLGAWGIRADDYLARDGSGLSRYDWVTSDALAALLAHLRADPRHADLFRDALPVSGVSGSLANRLKDTPAAARVWAKSGAMSQVRSLSGYLVTLDGEPLVFSVIVNGFRVPARDIDAIVDRALVKLVEFKRGP